MALNEPVLPARGAGRTVTYGDGSSAELKLVGEQSGGEWAVVVSCECARATNRRSIPTPARTRRCTSWRARSPRTWAARRSRSRPAHTRRSRRTCRTVSPCVVSKCGSPRHRRAGGSGVLLRAPRRVRRRPREVRCDHPRGSPGDVTQLAGLRRRSRTSAAAAFDYREAEPKLTWRQRGSHQDRGRHRTDRDRCSGDQGGGGRTLAEHGVWGPPHQGRRSPPLATLTPDRPGRIVRSRRAIEPGTYSRTLQLRNAAP